MSGGRRLGGEGKSPTCGHGGLVYTETGSTTLQWTQWSTVSSLRHPSLGHA